jgi:hypothetical protein
VTPAEEAAAHWGGRILRLLRDRENQVFEMDCRMARAALRLHRQGYQSPEAIRSELWWCAELGPGWPAGSGGPARLRRCAAGAAVRWPPRLGHRLDRGRGLGEAAAPFPRPMPEVLDLYHALGALLAQGPQDDRRPDPAAGLHPPALGLGRAGRGQSALGPVLGPSGRHPDQRRDLIRARDALRERLSGEMGLIHADVLRENVLVNGRSVSLIDFDDSGFGFRLHDLGTALADGAAP